MSTEAAVADAPPADTAPLDTFATPDAFGSVLDAFFNEAEAAPALPTVAASTETPATGDDLVTPGEKTPEDPLSELDDHKEWTPQAARRFKEIKASEKAAKAQLAELQTQLTQRESRLQELEALANDPKVQELTSKAAEYEQTLLLRDLENSSAYKSLVRAPLERITGEIDALAAKYSISGDDLIDVVVMEDEAAQDERLGELLANASDRDKRKIYKLIEETQPVLAQRASLHANAQEAMAELNELERQRDQMTLVERSQQRATAASEVAKRIEKSLPFLTSFEGVDLTALAKEAGETDYGKLDPAIGTYNTMAGKLLPKLANNYRALQRELASVVEQLAEYDRTGSPLARGGSPDPVTGRRGGDNISFADAIEAAFPR